jgi:hypothetical protein
MSVDDLLQLLHHHWVMCTDYDAIERQCVQHALIILLMVYTSARAGTIVEGGGYYDANDCLKEDIEISKSKILKCLQEAS